MLQTLPNQGTTSQSNFRTWALPLHLSSSMMSTNNLHKVHFLKDYIYCLFCNKCNKHSQMCLITKATTLETLYSSLYAVGLWTDGETACFLFLIQKTTEITRRDVRKPLPFTIVCMVY